MDPTSQPEAVWLVLNEPASRIALECNINTWQAWRKRMREGTLNDTKQVEILSKMGYKVAVERVWINTNSN